ncbi:MAG: tRNA lysidine(34) synthetase TilS, partial [Candidatus Omnitrophica bacterium]|nr:tRNA lysidine(34) synthetase TilS [Candidatus Omnitrophota bacterium]
TCSVPTIREVFASRLGDLWPEGAPHRALLAVSGGADSTAMALLAKGSDSSFFEHLAMAHFHHHLREEEAERDAEFVKNLSQELQLPYFRGDWSPGERHENHRVDRNLQAAARKARYEFLFETAKAQGCPVLLTAHHARDQVETLLHNLSRGGRSGAFQGIRPRIRREGIWILRPLLWIFPEELRIYLDKEGQPHCEDSSNASTHYRRNWIRSQLLSKIREADPTFEQEMLERWEGHRLDQESITPLIEMVKRQSLRREDEWVIPMGGLRDLDEDTRVACLRWFLRDLVKDQASHGWDPIRQAPLEALLDLIDSGEEGTINLPTQIRAEVRGRGLALQAK